MRSKKAKKPKMRELVCTSCGRRASILAAHQWKKLACGLYCLGKFKQVEKP